MKPFLYIGRDSGVIDLLLMSLHTFSPDQNNPAACGILSDLWLEVACGHFDPQMDKPLDCY